MKFSLTPCSLNKESVAVMGWKAIKGAVKGEGNDSSLTGIVPDYLEKFSVRFSELTVESSSRGCASFISRGIT